MSRFFTFFDTFIGSGYAVTMWNHPDRPYQDLPALPPSGVVETPAVLKATITASRALARLDGAYKRLPDPTMLINLIPLMEAQASSEIENIVTTNDELFKAANGALPDVTPQVKEALRYREALRAGHESLATRPITTKTAIEVCSHIHARTAIIRDQPGTYIGNPTTGNRMYTPPEGRDVILDHLSAWERFLHSNHGLDPLVVMALSHYQFEAIHPFFDGNGRTGRVLNLLILIETGLLQLPILYLSGHVMRHKDTYYERLDAVTREDAWEPWILFMLDGVESTARWTLDLVETTDTMRLPRSPGSCSRSPTSGSTTSWRLASPSARLLPGGSPRSLTRGWSSRRRSAETSCSSTHACSRRCSRRPCPTEAPPHHGGAPRVPRPGPEGGTPPRPIITSSTVRR